MPKRKVTYADQTITLAGGKVVHNKTVSKSVGSDDEGSISIVTVKDGKRSSRRVKVVRIGGNRWKQR
jgi:hypothetical protein